MMKFDNQIYRFVLLFVAAFCFGAGTPKSVRAGEGSAGAVYALSNEADGNQLIVFRRDKNGGIALAGTVATGDAGLGGGLGSQGALAFGTSSSVLYAVNAGSNSISVIKLGSKGPRVVQTINSAGLEPISLTAAKDALYVLNRGSSENDVDQITGFRIDANSQQLSVIPNSTRGLSVPSGGGPVQVSFDPQGKVVLVAEKLSNKIDTFLVNPDGTTGPISVQASHGMTPFGFSFNQKGFLIGTEAFGGNAGESAVSSYSLNSSTGMLQVISGSVPTTQTSACWMAVTSNGRYAYTSNTTSGTITGFSVGDRGDLTILNADGITGITGGKPADSAIVGDKFLYVLTILDTEGVVTAFKIAADGSLQMIGFVGGLPTSTVGLAAE